MASENFRTVFLGHPGLLWAILDLLDEIDHHMSAHLEEHTKSSHFIPILALYRTLMSWDRLITSSLIFSRFSMSANNLIKPKGFQESWN